MVLSSAIVCDRDCRIAEVFFFFHMIADDRRPGTRGELLQTSAWEAIGTIARNILLLQN